MSGHRTTRRHFLAATGPAVGVSLLGATVSVPATEQMCPELHQKRDPKPVAIGLIQMRCDGKTPSDNLKKAIELVAKARAKGAQLVVLPELFCTEYFCRAGGKHNSPEALAAEKAIATAKKNLSVAVKGPEVTALGQAASDNKVVLVGGSVFEKAGEEYFNTSVVFGPDGKQLGVYRKTHIPHDPGFWEQHYFLPGDTGIRVFDTPVGKVAVQICYDQWFPEAARLATLQGAEIIVYPTAIGDVDLMKEDDEGNWREMWTAAQVGHAACNNVFVAAANRVGREGPTTFWGGSFVADPCGRILKQAGVAEEVVIVGVDRALIKSTQCGWRFVQERRPAQYRGLTELPK